MGTEGEGARRARERMRRGIEEVARRMLPALVEKRDRERAAIEKAIAEDEHGYVWWHHWKARSTRDV